MPSQLSLHNVTKRYADRTVLDGVSCGIAADERTAIIGGNGSGQPTLLRLLAGRGKVKSSPPAASATWGRTRRCPGT
ncbi:ATP-binding cassette domain-containing protein [Plantactinospora sp. KLBMP9567]|uniref:ATP-binding cassette domain-containing protein n=1 Tax=Plantactinospora sp. KLBMP9567 TaxID=3085900 RepID=UPI002980D6D0|nr:ATP-binding cassette domain-containing protein [Plantactinospora sp. KLBMP9567]MDW5324660.1 ATP-binding cassette domain-containing protein [Plantactinospora sp. KLBMP9567]